jgi:hypothetical protein
MLVTLSGHGGYAWLSMQDVLKSFKKFNEHITNITFDPHENSK